MTITLWLIYALGQGMHMLKRANMVAGSKLNGIQSIRHYVRLNWPAMAVRWFLASMLLIYWSNNPTALNVLVSHFGINTGGLEIPFTNASVGIYGFAADSLLDWITGKVPRLQKEIPPLRENGQPGDPAPPQAGIGGGGK